MFDGYPDACYKQDNSGARVIFSRNNSADERIKCMLEEQGKTNNTVVVSDDKEIRLFTKACGAKSVNVEEFLSFKGKRSPGSSNSAEDRELNYSQMHEINEELKKIWLK